MISRSIPDKELFGSRLPWYLGVCWREIDTRATRVAPIPLNFLIGWVFRFYYRLVSGPRNRFIEKAERREALEYSKGHTHGYAAGHKAGDKYRRDLLNKVFDEWRKERGFG